MQGATFRGTRWGFEPVFLQRQAAQQLLDVFQKNASEA